MSWDGNERRKDSLDMLERIHNLEIQVSRLADSLEDEKENRTNILDNIMHMLKNQNSIIYGDNSIVGVKEEINILKRKEAERQFHLNAVSVAVIGGFFKMIFVYFNKKIGGG